MKKTVSLSLNTLIAIGIWNLLDRFYYVTVYKGPYHFSILRNILVPLIVSILVDVFTYLNDKRKADKEKRS